MKLVITPEKLTREFVKAAPVFGRYKGSVLAVRMLMNMLGYKCLITSTAPSADFTIYGTSAYLKDTSTLFSTNAIGDYCAATHNMTTKEKEYLTSSGYGRDYIISPEMIDEHSTNPTQLAAINVPVLKSYSKGDVNYISFRLDNTQIVSGITDAQMCRFALQSYSCVPAVFDFNIKRNYVNEDINISFEGIRTTINSTNLCILLTNVTDKSLQPVKSILSKQLQEVLPINIVVTPENIIGCASDE